MYTTESCFATPAGQYQWEAEKVYIQGMAVLHAALGTEVAQAIPDIVRDPGEPIERARLARLIAAKLEAAQQDSVADVDQRRVPMDLRAAAAGAGIRTGPGVATLVAERPAGSVVRIGRDVQVSSGAVTASCLDTGMELAFHRHHARRRFAVQVRRQVV
ncbi:hypothetical protein [Nocardia nova]|uniref:hypothetical protein n=1 Tax=Nocardia nova TaxID=37330 RepID=UPI0011B09A1A|nr:hypothetical protein [Nocardia nova]